MSFAFPGYHAPDFQSEKFVNAPDVKTAAVTKDGVAPENFHSTSIYPEYFKIGGRWKLAEDSRMDCSVVIRPDGKLEVLEYRILRKRRRAAEISSFSAKTAAARPLTREITTDL